MHCFFGISQNEEVLAVNVVKSSFSIIQGDGLPEKFCIICLSELLKVYDFRQKCRKSLKILQLKLKLPRKRKLSQTQLDPQPSCSKQLKTECDYENIIVKNEIMYEEGDEEDDVADAEELEMTEEWVANVDEGEEVEEEEADAEELKEDDVDDNSAGTKFVLQTPQPGNNGEFTKVAADDSSKLIYVSKKKEHPDLGQFKITVMRGYKNSSHVVYEANGFLYVNTRNTPHRRYLRCSTSRNCPGKACIDVKPKDVIEEFLYVYKLHNHPKDTLHITKLKFLEEMRVVATLGNYSPKQVYEITIKKFPELRTIMPYSTLSSRLYRLSTGQNQSHSITTLMKFGKYLDKEKPVKYCKTHDGEQFYQETVIDDSTNSCSIIFANTVLIENMSWSNELFIDSSFQVGFENGEYTFLTISISVNEHRFPIYFVIMNQSTIEEYVKVLMLFKDKYAPSLHPEEIATDFNAPLFKAVSIVYNHSTISGSLIHYIFYLYKKCSAEDIIKVIELKAGGMKMQSNLFALPILPPHLIPMGLQHLKSEAAQNPSMQIFNNIFKYVEDVWINEVTPQVFSSFCNISSVNENIFNSFKKMRDIITANKKYKFLELAEKLLAIEEWVSTTYRKVLYGEKLPRQIAASRYAKVLDKLWQPNQIEKHGFHHFFETVSPLIEKMTSLIWIWGFYSYDGKEVEDLITPQDYFGTEIVEQVLSTEDGQPAQMLMEANVEDEIEEDGTQVITLQLIKPEPGLNETF